MAKKMTDEEIRQFINSKSVTQNNYVAPTVKSNTVSAPAMSVVASKPTVTVQPSSVKSAIKQYGDVLKNSAVKNRGFSISNAITDLANIYDARRNIATSVPGVGKVYDTGTKTLGNIATNMGIGATKSIEGAADALSDLYFNPRERFQNYIADYVRGGKKLADENLKDLKEQQKRDIARNRTEEFLQGYNEVLPEWEKNSLVRQDNLGGQVAQGVGGMVPSLILGGAYGANPQMTDLSNLAGREKLMAALGNVGNTYMAQLPANAMLGATSYGSGVEDALNQGASMNQARLYGLTNAAIEQGTEMLTGGVPGLEGRGGIDQFIDPLIGRTGGYLNPLLKAGYGALGEGLEESVGTYLDALAKRGILGQDINWDEVNREALQSGLVGAATGAILNTPSNIQNFNEVRQERANRPVTQTQLSEKVQETASEPTQTTQEAQNVEERPINQEAQNESQEATETRYSIPSESKVQNFRDSVQREGIKDADGFYKAVEKIIQDKDYNVIMDSSIKNADGKPVNALISNENGITIKINPNSERAGEILLMHEVTHGIETKEMSDLIMDYASKNPEFNSALEDLKSTYGTQEVTPEVVADISGQLFGNQEFINNLSTQKPSIFRRIYDAIVSMANKLTGNSKEALFIRDLRNKWESAYRGSTIESSQKTLKEATRYSLNSELEEMQNMVNKNAKTDRTTNNEGEKLSKGQQEFFKDVSPEVRDKNGGLKKVYHTVNHPIVQFNEFNPVGTPGYRFGDQVVIYTTPSKEMSGSYADQEYEMADTQRLNSVEEAENWLFEEGLPYYSINNNTVFDDVGAPILQYKNKNELLRNIKSDIAAEEGYSSNLQYEGYVNIKNPFVVESSGSEWDSVSERYDEERAKLYDDAVKNKKQAIKDLVSESREKQKTEYEDKKIRKQIEFNSDILNNFKDEKLNNIFKKLNVGSDITELHPLIRDAKNYEDFVKRAEKYNIDLPNANTKLFDLIDRDIFDYYLDNENIKVDMSTATIEDFVNHLIKLYETEGVYGAPDRYFYFNMDKVFGEAPVEEIISPSEWIEAVDEDFSQEIKEQLEKKPMTTNDVVKYVIAENLQRADNEKYDGVIFKKIYDYGGESLDETPEDVYAIFNSNQFKAADNLNPTDDPDIRYSQDASKWQDFLEKNFKSRGTTTNLREKTGKQPKPTKLKESNGKYTRQDVVERAEEIKKKFDNQTLTNKKGKKVSNFYSNITEKSQFIEPETREKLKNEKDIKFYKGVTNEEALNEAVEKIGTTPASQSKALNEFLSKEDQFTATDMAEGWVFLKQYQDAGNYDAMASVAKKMREMGTKSGQAIQMLGLEARLTPEGMYRFAVNELAEAEQKFNSEKGRTKEEIDRYRNNFQLTPEETEFIKSQMEKVQGMEPGRERDIEVAKINKMLSDKLPHEKGRSLKAWMRLSMLFNPKTQVRNVMGNALITPVNALADVAAGVTDRLVSKKTGARTIGGPSLGGLAAYGKGAVKGIKQATQDYRLGIDTKNINQNRFDIGQGKAFNEQHKGPFKNVRNAVAKGLNATNDFLGYVMDAGDRAFYQGSVENSLYNQQKLNNTTEVTKEMADIAEMEGLQRTWNDDNQFTKAVLNIRRAINDIGGLMHVKVGEYGLGDLMIPFAKTPANLTKAIVDYSPVGFLNAATEGKNLKRAIATGNYTQQQQHDFAQTVGKATAGTLLYALGTALAKAKITTGNSDEDKDLKNFMRYNLGIQPYSIKIGNKSFTYDWAQPIAAPFAITADIEKGKEENMTPAQAIQQFLTTGFNILTEQSFLSGINEVLNDNDGILHGIEQEIINLPATAIPTLLKQFTDMTDGTKRQTFSKEGMTENAKKYAMSKTPTGSKKLAPQVDVLGNEIEKYGGDNSAFNIFLNPANTEKGKTSDVSEEIYALYQATGDKTIIPRKVDYSITIDGKKRTLTTDEMAKWQKASGKYVTENVRKAMNDEDYQNMSDEDKAAVINKIVNYSYMKAKSETFDTKLSSYYSGVKKAEDKGIPMYDYYISKTKRSD